MKMKKGFYILITLLSITYFLKSEPADSSKIRILLANIKISNSAKDISETKVDAAFHLAALLSEKYESIPISIRDSIVLQMQKDSLKPTAFDVACQLKADRVFSLSVNQFKNMLRVEIVSSKVQEKQEKTIGVGYSLIHFMKYDEDTPLYDPSLLESIQRAFAVAEHDSSLYSKVEGKLNVMPAKTLVIGGIEFLNDKTLTPTELFDKKEVISYSILENIFDATKDSKNFVCYDLETRDSIYAVYNLYIMENHRGPTAMELEALNKFAVDCYITGTFKRVEGGAELELLLCNIDKNNLNIVSKEKGFLSEDSIDKLMALAKELTKKILKLD
jgi:hypothetical protein